MPRPDQQARVLGEGAERALRRAGPRSLLLRDVRRRRPFRHQWRGEGSVLHGRRDPVPLVGRRRRLRQQHLRGVPGSARSTEQPSADLQRPALARSVPTRPISRPPSAAALLRQQHPAETPPDALRARRGTAAVHGAVGAQSASAVAPRTHALRLPPREGASRGPQSRQDRRVSPGGGVLPRVRVHGPAAPSGREVRRPDPGDGARVRGCSRVRADGGQSGRAGRRRLARRLRPAARPPRVLGREQGCGLVPRSRRRAHLWVEFARAGDLFEEWRARPDRDARRPHPSAVGLFRRLREHQEDQNDGEYLSGRVALPPNG